MKSSKEGFFATSREARRGLREILAIVIGFSFAVNFISAAVFDLGGWRASATVGLLISIACAFYVVKSRVGTREFKVQISALFAYGNEDRENLVPLPGYYFSERFGEAAHAVFAENEALLSQWVQRHPDGEHREVSGGFVYRPDPWVRLVRELAEYVVLSRLSTHLTDYFDREGFDESKIEYLSRNKAPEILLHNRVLEIISRDVKDRPGFEGHAEDKEGVELVASNSGRRIYSRFQLALPRGSKLTREPNGTLVIDGPVLRVEISCRFDGYSAIVPPNFCRKVLRVEFLDLDPKAVEITMRFKLNRPLRTTEDAWRYYAWAESFVQRADKEFSFETYLQEMRWPMLNILFIAEDDGKRKKHPRGGSAKLGIIEGAVVHDSPDESG